uniref:Uncharacterized protein n=1 Tax=Strongyloides papillosus TaxID=174720 RepID=A0A0N5B701_STREA
MIFLNHIKKYIFLISFIELVKSNLSSRRSSSSSSISVNSILSRSSIDSTGSSISVNSILSRASKGSTGSSSLINHRGFFNSGARNSLPGSQWNLRRGSDGSIRSNAGTTNSRNRHGHTLFSRIRSRFSRSRLRKNGNSRNDKNKLFRRT